MKKLLLENISENVKSSITIPVEYNYTQPFWLKNKHNGKMFSYNPSSVYNLAENEPEIKSIFSLKIDGTSFQYEIPVQYKWNDAIKGEQSRPIVIQPDLSISVDQKNYRSQTNLRFPA